MPDLRLTIARTVCRLVSFSSRLLGKNGSSKPGQIALKIDPNLIQKLSKQVKNKIIVITGTNGKTSTNNMLAQVLTSAGNDVVSNLEGSNMLSGIATALLLHKKQPDYACFEVDEAFCRHLFKMLSPDIFVVMNLFADQTDRYGKDGPFKFIEEAIQSVPDVTLLLNAHDPQTALLGEGRNAHYFSFHGEGTTSSIQTPCPRCGRFLSYTDIHYDHLGTYSCSCGFSTPQGDFCVENPEHTHDGKLSFLFNNTRFKINGNAPFYIYNAGFVLSVLSLLGEVHQNIPNLMENGVKLPGRMEEFKLNIPVIINMAKNPAGFNQTIDAICHDERTKCYLISVNDFDPDGNDVTWLWDVSFERLFADSNATFILCGSRAGALSIRLKYVNCPCEYFVVSNEEEAIRILLSSKRDVLYIISNYTATFQLRKVLLKFEKKMKKSKGDQNHG